MIERKPVGNRFMRAFSGLLGDDLYYEYVVPDLLSHTIYQPLGVEIRLKGPKDNLDVICATSTGILPFSAILPEGVRIVVGASKYNSFRAHVNKGEIEIPRNLRLMKFIPAFAIFHEGGHFWSKMDEEWTRQVRDANRQLYVQLFSREIDGYTWLPQDPSEREAHLVSWQALGEEERRAWGTALYILGYLRRMGFDPLPHLKEPRDLLKPINYAIKTQEGLNTKSQFSLEEVNEFISGELPWPRIKQSVDARLQSTLPSPIHWLKS